MVEVNPPHTHTYGPGGPLSYNSLGEIYSLLRQRNQITVLLQVLR